jgi:hypothetical protein
MPDLEFNLRQSAESPIIYSKACALHHSLKSSAVSWKLLIILNELCVCLNVNYRRRRNGGFSQAVDRFSVFKTSFAEFRANVGAGIEVGPRGHAC